MRRPNLLRTSIFRLTLLYVALFGASVLTIFAVIYWATASYMSGALERIVETELSSLVNDYETGGIDRLVATIRERMASPGRRATYYLLQDGAGQPVAGNLAALTSKVGWQYIPAPRPGDDRDEDDVLRSQGLLLSNGYFLLVGEDIVQYLETMEIIVRSFGWGIAVTLCLALLGGVILSASMLSRVEAINRISQEIIDGNMSRRMPIRGSGDDFDHIATNINKMLDRIQILVDNLNQVSNDIAHDLRTPLTRLRRRLERARSAARTSADYDSAIDTAIAETDDILHTFGAVLRIAQIEAGTRQAGFSDVDLSGLIDAIVETYAAVAEDRGQSLAARVTPGRRFRGDRELLTQMFINLVENALRHTPPGSRVHIDLGDGLAGLACTIADDGPGIPETERGKVFRRFYRVAADRGTPGSGLGLSLVAAVADLHRIGVALADNRPGLQVILTFPPDASR